MGLGHEAPADSIVIPRDLLQPNGRRVVNRQMNGRHPTELALVVIMDGASLFLFEK